MSKPKIYGFCDAGCKWETVHKNDFEELAKQLPFYSDIDATDGVYLLQPLKQYRVSYKELDILSYKLQAKLQMTTTTGATVIFDSEEKLCTTSYVGDIMNRDNTIFSVLNYSLAALASAQGNVVVLCSINGATGYQYVPYDVNDIQDDYEGTFESIEVVGLVIKIDEADVNGVKVAASALNPNTELDPLVIVPYEVFIRYADDENGTNMSDKYNGQLYMGTYVGKEASTNPLDYTWMRSAIEDDDDVADELSNLKEEITDLKNALYGSILDVEQQTYENVGVAVIDRANTYPVVDNQKAQVVSVKGRTWIKNQLVDMNSFSNGTTLTTTKTGNDWDGTRIEFPYLANNKYLLITKLTKSDNCVVRYRTPEVKPIDENYFSFFYTGLGTETGTSSGVWYQYQSSDGNEATATIEQSICVNLTKMFGAGNEPTTVEQFNELTRNIDLSAYDEGSYINVNTTEIVSNGFNQFDEEWEVGGISFPSGQPNTNVYNAHSKNFIPVVYGKEYTISNGNYDAGTTTSGIYVIEYDENYNSIKRTSIGDFYEVNTIRHIQLLDNTCFIKFFIFISDYDFTNNLPPQGNFSVHLTGDGSFDGVYKPYVAPKTYTLTVSDLNGINDARDTQTETTLTRVIDSYTFTGNEGIARTQETDTGVAITIGLGSYLSNASAKNNNNLIAGLNAKTYQSATHTEANSFYFDATYFTINLGLTSVEETLSALSGKTLYYELSEPVITDNGLGEVLVNVERGGSIATDGNADITLDHVVYKPVEE